MADERIETPCAACGSRTLFVGTGGYLTCSMTGCAGPQAELDALRSALLDALTTLVAVAAQPATLGRLWAENPTLGQTLVRVRQALRQHTPVDPLRPS